MSRDRVAAETVREREDEAVQRPPRDRPGAEGEPSRAESRRGADVTGVLDEPIDDGGLTPRDVLARFKPADGSLPEVTEEEAAEYIARNAGERPWLAPLHDCEPCVQRVLVALDQGRGHALERHEGFADDEKLRRRVTGLEDPAQLDGAKRTAGIDGCRPGDKSHRCGDVATAIHDPRVFATAFARGLEHPDVQAALRTRYKSDVRPSPVSVPIAEILGPAGHLHCAGYQLLPVGGSLDAARDCRAAWVSAQADPEREPDVPPPRFAAVSSFEGATIEYVLRETHNKDGYEMNTMYVTPPASGG